MLRTERPATQGAPAVVPAAQLALPLAADLEGVVILPPGQERPAARGIREGDGSVAALRIENEGVSVASVDLDRLLALQAPTVSIRSVPFELPDGRDWSAVFANERATRGLDSCHSEDQDLFACRRLARRVAPRGRITGRPDRHRDGGRRRHREIQPVVRATSSLARAAIVERVGCTNDFDPL